MITKFNVSYDNIEFQFSPTIQLLSLNLYIIQLAYDWILCPKLVYL